MEDTKEMFDLDEELQKLERIKAKRRDDYNEIWEKRNETKQKYMTNLYF